MSKIPRESIDPVRFLKDDAESWKQIMDAFASMHGEDVSNLRFDKNISKPVNHIMIEFSSRFQAATAPIESLKMAIFAAIQERSLAEQGTVPGGVRATSSSSSANTEGPPSIPEQASRFRGSDG